MTPLLSVIVPYRDHRESLPRLLESIQRQSLKNVEVILVDDKSEKGCADIVTAFAGRGLRIRLLENERRVYVKDARLAGVREASADCFMFADADDMLWGETALETHVSLWRETRADIVHFRTVFTDETGRFAGHYSWADPFAPKLDGKDIFAAYTRSEIDGSAIWNKIFSRDLWMRLLPDLQEFPVKQACEDIFLNIRVFFHAQSYRGSDLTGYGFHYRPGGRDGRSLLRASTLCRMLDLLVPQMRSSGGDMEDLARLERAMANFLAICTGRAGIYAMNPGTVLGDFVQEALAQEDNERIIKTLLLGAGVNGKKLQNIYKSITGL